MSEADGHSSSKKKTLWSLLAIMLGMFLMAYASVPLYRTFCNITGFGGTTKVAAKAAPYVGTQTFTLRFNTDIEPGMPWEFKPEQKEVKVKTGQNGLAFFYAKNTSDKPVKGMATYNVTPEKLGRYFNKVQCFCFNEQLLQPGQQVDMPVSFFIDPEIEKDPEMRGIHTITLSYTFFEVKEKGKK